MKFFEKKSDPVFLKISSDTDEYIEKLKTLQEKAKGPIRDKIDLEIKFASFGQIGERNIAFELRNSGLPLYILHDIHLEIDGLSAQIDYIVVTRKHTIVIECKNLIGNISVDNEGNFVREYNLGGRKIKEGIYSPITQNERHLEVLKQIRRESRSNALSKMVFDKFFDDNYKAVVVLANPKTILNDRFAKKEIKNKIIRADQLIKYIKDLTASSSNLASSDVDMQKNAFSLLKLHKAKETDYAKKFEILIAEMKEPKNISSPNKDEIAQKLKEFRLHKSREENIKAYYIFTNAQMEELVERLPKTEEELGKISGFGSVKIKEYGKEILVILNSFLKK